MKVTHLCFWLFLMSVLIISSPVFASNQDSLLKKPPFFIISTALIILLCYRLRRRAIGGVLLYYYLNVFFSLPILLIIGLTSISDYNPQLWPDRNLFLLFVLATAPFYFIKIAEFIMAFVLLFNKFRSLFTVNILKTIYLILIIFSLISLLIDAMTFPEDIFPDFFNLTWGVVWLFYFRSSKRVELVLIKNDWEYKKFHKEHDSPSDFSPAISIIDGKKKKLFRNKAILFMVFSVLVLILGSLIVFASGQFQGLQTIAAIIIFAWGLGWYSLSKGYSRSLGLLLGALSWLGLLILFFLDDKTIIRSQNERSSD